MATVAPQMQPPVAATTRSPSIVSNAVSTRASSIASISNAHHDHDGHSAPQPPPAMTSKKSGKAKKAADPSETSKLLAAKISQLESDRAGEKDQEAEIEREVKKANRDLSNLLSNMESPLSRLNEVQKRYTELLADMRRLDRDHAKNKKRADQLQKEKDHGRTELSKTVSMKEKLEKLCRELQRENKKMKDEHKKLEETEKRNREELNENFENALWEIQDVIGQKEDPKSLKLNLETDELFRQKFKSFIDQYELRETHLHSVLRTKELEVQYNIARYEASKKSAEQEVARSRALSAQVSTFSQTEAELRSQLNIYVEKFKQVEDTLNNSNDLFLTFRKEMEEMSKKTKRLEKENLTLSRKHELTNRNILEMAEERTKTTKDMVALRKKNANLESLCRGMQAQGRGGALAAPAVGELDGHQMDDDGTESDYTYDDEDREDDEDEDASEVDDEDGGEYDDDTEEEVMHAEVVGADGKTYGNVIVPSRPPPLSTPQTSAQTAAQTQPPQLQTGKQVHLNGQKPMNGQAVVVNGSKH